MDGRPTVQINSSGIVWTAPKRSVAIQLSWNRQIVIYLLISCMLVAVDVVNKYSI